MALPETIKTNEDIINAFKAVLPYLNEVVEADITSVLSDGTKCLAVVPAKSFSLPLNVGDSMLEHPAIQDAMRTKRPSIVELPASVAGIAHCRSADLRHKRRGDRRRRCRLPSERHRNRA